MSMNNTTWKRLLTFTLAAVFTLAAHVATLAQRPSGAGRPSGQRPPNAQRDRENSPYADKYKNGQRRPPESRRQGNGHPQGTFPRN